MTSFRSRLLLFGYPLLEVATIYAVAIWIGWGWTLLALLAGIPIGFAIMRNAGDAAMTDLAASAGTGQPADPGRHGLTFVGGVLVAIPGFWTDLVGLLLVIPWTQRLFRTRARTWLSPRFTSVRMPGIRYPRNGDVIQGTVIRTDQTDPQNGSGPGGPTSGPTGPPGPPELPR